MNTKQAEISLVIPVFNETTHIRRTLRVIDQYINQAADSYEIIVIDDGSSDSTWNEIVAGRLEIPQLKGIRLSRNFEEKALCAGLEHAQGRAVIIMDADLQHPPELIPKMIEYWRSDAAKIVECVKKSRGKESLSYRIGTKFFYRMLHILTRYDLKGASDFKLLDRQVVDAWTKLPERITFFRGMTAWLGFKRVQIDYDVAPRIVGKTSWSFMNLVKLALNAVIGFTSWPLRFVTFAGVVLFIGAVVLGIHTFYMKLTGNAVTGFTTVIILLLGMNSMIMLGIGILGEYIAAIYDEVKGRPRYIVCQKTSEEMPKTDSVYNGEDVQVI